MRLQFRILIMFAVIFAASYIPETFPSYFGDWMCHGSGEFIGRHYKRCNHGGGFAMYHNPSWHWGFRHWAWLCLGITMLIINIVQLVAEEDKKSQNK